MTPRDSGGLRVWRRRRQAGRHTHRTAPATGLAAVAMQLGWHMVAGRPAVADRPVGVVVCPGPAVCLQIPSDKVPFNQLPDMKAYEITEAGKEALRSGKYKMVRQAGAQTQALLVAARGKGANRCRITQTQSQSCRPTATALTVCDHSQPHLRHALCVRLSVPRCASTMPTPTWWATRVTSRPPSTPVLLWTSASRTCWRSATTWAAGEGAVGHTCKPSVVPPVMCVVCSCAVCGMEADGLC